METEEYYIDLKKYEQIFQYQKNSSFFWSTGAKNRMPKVNFHYGEKNSINSELDYLENFIKMIDGINIKEMTFTYVEKTEYAEIAEFYKDLHEFGDEVNSLKNTNYTSEDCAKMEITCEGYFTYLSIRAKFLMLSYLISKEYDEYDEKDGTLIAEYDEKKDGSLITDYFAKLDSQIFYFLKLVKNFDDFQKVVGVIDKLYIDNEILAQRLAKRLSFFYLSQKAWIASMKNNFINLVVTKITNPMGDLESNFKQIAPLSEYFKGNSKNLSFQKTFSCPLLIISRIVKGKTQETYEVDIADHVKINLPGGVEKKDFINNIDASIFKLQSYLKFSTTKLISAASSILYENKKLSWFDFDETDKFVDEFERITGALNFCILLTVSKCALTESLLEEDEVLKQILIDYNNTFVKLINKTLKPKEEQDFFLDQQIQIGNILGYFTNSHTQEFSLKNIEKFVECQYEKNECFKFGLHILYLLLKKMDTKDSDKEKMVDLVIELDKTEFNKIVFQMSKIRNNSNTKDNNKIMGGKLLFDIYVSYVSLTKSLSSLQLLEKSIRVCFQTIAVMFDKKDLLDRADKPITKDMLQQHDEDIESFKNLCLLKKELVEKFLSEVNKVNNEGNGLDKYSYSGTFWIKEMSIELASIIAETVNLIVLSGWEEGTDTKPTASSQLVSFASEYFSKEEDELSKKISSHITGIEVTEEEIINTNNEVETLEISITQLFGYDECSNEFSKDVEGIKDKIDKMNNLKILTPFCYLNYFWHWMGKEDKYPNMRGFNYKIDECTKTILQIHESWKSKKFYGCKNQKNALCLNVGRSNESCSKLVLKVELY